MSEPRERWTAEAQLPGGDGSSHITRTGVSDLIDVFPLWRKKHLTPAVRMSGPFTVRTREGVLSCPDGWLAIDSAGWPYPIAAEEFAEIYEHVEDPDA